jgi:orotidine-5'-phosphate decarboxylase
MMGGRIRAAAKKANLRIEKELKTMERNFREMLASRWETANSMVCVGLDSELGKIPREATRVGWTAGETILMFNCAIVDATHDLVAAYKPNIAFYERYGAIGLRALQETIKYIHRIAPDVLVIDDAKRADIGNTNDGYVAAAFDYCNADAITINPYLGAEALQPFLDRKDKGVFILCRTSNPGAGELQDMMVNVTEEQFEQIHLGWRMHDGFVMSKVMPFWQYIAHRVTAQSTGWNKNGNCGVVVGATCPDELRAARKIVGDMPILVPGVGAQGGDVQATVKAGVDSKGRGMLINSSRGIIFASSGPDFAEAARRETMKLRDQINQYR